ncbi:hypothetical protein AA309_28880 [Microvirga vignae]|uniref:DDE domain-containing protein n=1 Tax=Microvirga vignae TaxID=1225564 RepID=A0A0H1R511_9HYPH|nr:hypothetical protein AA309_28880 [Microvirga vignae]
MEDHARALILIALAGKIEESYNAGGKREDKSGSRPSDLNKRIEQDYRAVERRVRLMPGFRPIVSAHVILGGVEMVHMMRKGQAKYACRPHLSLAEQFDILAA